MLSSLKHPNIVELQDVVEDDSDLYLVFELMDGSFLDLIQDGKPLAEDDALDLMKQVWSGLAFLHDLGWMHRDLKPENLLFRRAATQQRRVAKIADFGLVRSWARLGSRPLTEYVATRWYRAPEILLRCRRYGPEVDIWATGAIVAELISGVPLFNGESERDQIQRILERIGVRGLDDWPEGVDALHKMRFRFNVLKQTSLVQCLPGISSGTVRVISHCLALQPELRPDADKLVRQLSGQGSSTIESSRIFGSISNYLDDCESRTAMEKGNKRPRPRPEPDQLSSRIPTHQFDELPAGCFDLSITRPKKVARLLP